MLEGWLAEVVERVPLERLESAELVALVPVWRLVEDVVGEVALAELELDGDVEVDEPTVPEALSEPEALPLAEALGLELV